MFNCNVTASIECTHLSGFPTQIYVNVQTVAGWLEFPITETNGAGG